MGDVKMMKEKSIGDVVHAFVDWIDSKFGGEKTIEKVIGNFKREIAQFDKAIESCLNRKYASENRMVEKRKALEVEEVKHTERVATIEKNVKMASNIKSNLDKILNEKI